MLLKNKERLQKDEKKLRTDIKNVLKKKKRKRVNIIMILIKIFLKKKNERKLST